MRKGQQAPTRTVVIKYKKTLGGDALALYEATGRVAQEWQKIQINNILAVNKDGLWTHSKYGYTLPRRNGKTEVVFMRELYALMHGEKVLHTAHRTSTSSASAHKLAQFLDDMGYTEVERVKKDETYKKCYVFAKQFGLEKIRVLDDGGGVVNFRTRTSQGGLGEGFDLMIIDEAQEYTEDQDSALKYTISDSPNPQMILCGTPPTQVSIGTVFEKLRYDALDGKTEDTGWAEWSVDSEVDVHDTEYWYLTNPSLGTILTERKIRAEISDDITDFLIQRLGLWYKQNQKSAIDARDWDKLIMLNPQPVGKMFVGVKYGKEGGNVSLSVAVRTKDNLVFVDAVDCRPVRDGDGWILDFLRRNETKIEAVIIDGASGQGLLAKAMQDTGIKLKPVLPKVPEVILANSSFESAIYAETIRHGKQPSLDDVVSNCGKRPIGSSGGFGYKSLKADCDISLMDSVIFAHWMCATYKPKKKQRAIY